MGTLQFNENNLVYKFALKTGNESIVLQKAIFNSLGDNLTQWPNKVTRLEPMLYITFLKLNGKRSLPPICLNSLIGPNHLRPVVEFLDFQKILLNDKKTLNDNWPGYYDTCELEIKFTPQEDAKIDLTLFYETSPGVAVWKN